MNEEFDKYFCILSTIMHLYVNINKSKEQKWIPFLHTESYV